jgi:oligopeptide/dipeptide ABC transporter ATP-binding protein
MLEVKGLSKTFDIGGGLLRGPKVRLRAVDDVSFSLAPNEVLGIAGESGSGKSTLARAALRLIEPTSGEVRFRGQDVLGLGATDLKRFRRKAQFVFQDPFGSLNPRMSIAEIVGEPLRIQGLEPDARRRRERVTGLLNRVSLGSEFLDRWPHELSGGQRQRVGIARALSVGPELLVADEPVSALDVSIQAQILNLLQDLRERLGLAMLFISHDIAVLDVMSDRIAVVYLGRIVEIGPKRDLLSRPRHPYTQALLSAVPEPGRRRRQRIVLKGDVPSPADPPSGCAFRTRCLYALPECAIARPPLSTPQVGVFQQINQLVQEQLAVVGIKARLAPVAQSEWYDLLVKKQTNFSPTRWTQRPDPDGLLYILFHSKGFANTTGYSNEKVDMLLEAGRNTYEAAERKRIYDAMQAIIAKDVPMLSLFYSVEYGALRDTVVGFEWVPDQIPRYRDLWKKAK